MTELEQELRDRIIDWLNLEHVNRESIDSGTELFGGAFGLDSIDAIELEVMLHRHYGIKVRPSERSASTFADLATLGRFVDAHRDRDRDEPGGGTP